MMLITQQFERISSTYQARAPSSVARHMNGAEAVSGMPYRDDFSFCRQCLARAADGYLLQAR